MSILTTLCPDAEEREQGRFRPEKLAIAVDALQRDGIVILEDVVSLASVAALRDKMTLDVTALLARKDRPFNWNSGNLQQNPSPYPPYLYRDIVVNDFAIQVTLAVLGRGQKNVMYSGNTAIRSNDRQPVHADAGQLWPNQDHVHPAYGLVVNFPLVDVSAENGSTEIWPGSHLDPTVAMSDGNLEVPEAKLEERRQFSPPLQPEVKAGSLVIRDLRLWHAGMPNHTDVPRPMIALIHHVGWWFSGTPLRFPRGTENIFEHPDLYTAAEFVSEDINYIDAPQSFGYAETEDDVAQV